jgi:hypothetical protein
MQVLSVKTQIYCLINQLRVSATVGSHHHSDPQKIKWERDNASIQQWVWNIKSNYVNILAFE